MNIEPLNIVRDELNGLITGMISMAPNLLAAALVLILTLVVAAFAVRFTNLISSRSKLRPSLQRVISSLIRLSIWIVGFLVAATILFPNLTPTKLLAGLGLGSIAVGLAFKDVFENFLAGLLILIRQPMRIGDDIECGDVSGKVEEITIRDTFVRKRSGELILVPNSYIFKNPTIVLTDKPLRRMSLTVGIAYGEDVDAARSLIKETVSALETVSSDEPVEVFASEFNSSSVDFLVRWWTGSTPKDEHESRSELIVAIKNALDGAGIEIPFPYRTLTFKDDLKIANDKSVDTAT